MVDISNWNDRQQWTGMAEIETALLYVNICFCMLTAWQMA